MKKHNFSAGPSILPTEVITEAAEGILDIQGNGLSIVEISHRSATFSDIIGEAEALVKELLGLNDDYVVLFLSGGASSQFYMVPLNILFGGKAAAYIDTGIWSAKAIKEAKLYGEIAVAATSKDKNYNYIPKSYTIPPDVCYVHYTSNNTIFGTQFKDAPLIESLLVSDMSSDIFSKTIDVSRHGIIYAGAQKNMGPAGVTLVIINKSFLGTPHREIPTMLNYHTHIEKKSLFNTPPVFPIYVSMLNLRWLKSKGGIASFEEHNQKKALLLYHEIDRNSMFYTPISEVDRSYMNVCFLMNDSSKETQFSDLCSQAGIIGVKGHRLAGGFRASIYNAMPTESIRVLIDVMQTFESQYG